MQLTIIRVCLRVDEGEYLLWGMNSDVRKTVGDNRSRETEKPVNQTGENRPIILHKKVQMRMGEVEREGKVLYETK